MLSPELIARFESATSRLQQLLSSFNEQQINTIPFTGSWTAAQLGEHLRLSDASVLRALNGPATPSDRPPDAKAAELDTFFNDLSNKLDAPEITAPGAGPFEQKYLLSSLDDSRARLRKATGELDLSAVSCHPILKEFTRLELVHFVVYHTERHLHQLQRIHDALAGR